MKILGINSYTYIGRNDGVEHSGYSLYVSTEPANVAGFSIRTINASERVLDTALKTFGLKDHVELINRDLNVYYQYNRTNRTFNAIAIVK